MWSYKSDDMVLAQNLELATLMSAQEGDDPVARVNLETLMDCSVYQESDLPPVWKPYNLAELGAGKFPVGDTHYQVDQGWKLWVVANVKSCVNKQADSWLAA